MNKEPGAYIINEDKTVSPDLNDEAMAAREKIKQEPADKAEPVKGASSAKK